MHNRALSKLCLALVGILVVPLVSAQTGEFPRTEYGDPDLQGTYTFRTLTPLTRPRELADKATLTEAEAMECPAYENRRLNRDLIIQAV